MTVLAFPVRPRVASRTEAPALPDPRAADRSLVRLLGLPEGSEDLPPRADLVLALLALAEATKQKALLPVALVPMEIALVRRGASVLCSAYHTDASPEVVSLDRRVPLRALLDAAAAALDGDPELDPASIERLRARASSAEIVPVADDGTGAIHAQGGVVADPGESTVLAFGFEIGVFPSRVETSERLSHADVHAMLFGGRLWAWARGRRIPILRGPVLLAVQRMLVATSAVIEAAEQGRPANVRLRAGSFVVGLRRDKAGEVSLSVGSDEDGVVTVPALELEAAAGPILRLASDILRTLVGVDRAQARNLRVRALRAEVRRLFRMLKARSRTTGFVNADPERLRASAPPGEPTAERGPRTAKWTSRWSVALDGLDAEQVHQAGPILLVGSDRGFSAIDRDEGRLVWRSEEPALASYLAGAHVLILGAHGRVECREVLSGDTVFRTKVAPRTGSQPVALVAMSSSLVPTAVVAEGEDRLVALDLRTGEPRWRFQTKGHGAFRLRRAGRVLLVASGDTSLVALDLLSGEPCWRFVDDLRVSTPPVVVGDTVVALLGEPGRGARELVGLDLYEGRVRFRTTLEEPAAAAPLAAGDAVLVPTVGGRRGQLVVLEGRTGIVRWTVADPGVASGAGVLSVDDQLVVNAPGLTTSLDLSSGETRWQSRGQRDQRDDVPRRLDPLLRAGVMITPGTSVEVLRQTDGTRIGGALPCDLVPDALLADERGWIYVGEESGHLSALAPVPRLSLVR